MRTPGYIPFKRPREVGWLLADLFDLYCSYQPDSFTFEWLQETTDLEVRCRDATGEKVEYPTSPALLEAIHNCKDISSRENARPLPSDYGFTGFIEHAIHEVQQEVPITEPELFRGPLFWQLGAGFVVDAYRRILGSRFFPHRHDHWSCMIRDHSSPFDPIQQEKRGDYLLKSELIAVTSIMYRQMNEMIWICEKQNYGAKLRYKHGPLTVVNADMPPLATIVTFIPKKVRIVQATCNPSDKLPKLIFTLRATYNFGKDDYDKNTAYNIMKWILSPPEAQPAKGLAVRGKKQHSL